MMNIDKSKYRIVEDGGKKYILVSQVTAYAREHFNSPFRIPSYRTIRYYVTNRVFERPQRLGKETFFELDYIIGAISVMRILSVFDPTIQQLRGVITNARRLNQFDEVFELISATMKKLGNPMAEEAFMEELSVKKPKDIRVEDIINKYP